MKRRFSLMLLLASLLIVAGIAVPAAAQVEDIETYQVTLTNMSRSQIISPPLLVTHNFGARLFLPGREASPELAAMAEDADLSGLINALTADPAVFEIVTGDGVLMPGHSVSFEIRTSNQFRRLSAVGMLVTTNDAFFGLEGLILYGGERRKQAHLPAYDAGSEANNESCEFIPGPPCGNMFVRATEGAEGYVHVHNGMFGIGDLPQAEYTWLNPVVLMRAVRVDPAP